MADRLRRSEFVGVGCLVQGVGIFLFLASWAGGIVGGIFGLMLMLVLLLVGSRMSLKWICGDCRNRLESKEVRLCPTCHATFE